MKSMERKENASAGEFQGVSWDRLRRRKFEAVGGGAKRRSPLVIQLLITISSISFLPEVSIWGFVRHNRGGDTRNVDFSFSSPRPFHSSEYPPSLPPTSLINDGNTLLVLRVGPGFNDYTPFAY